ncbi:MAG: hypothetical protein ACHQNT_05885 [Bacteroidia bacterium]
MNKVGEIKKYTALNWQYEGFGMPFWWLSKAEELKHSADILWRDIATEGNAFLELCEKIKKGGKIITQPRRPSVMNSFLLISGLSLENLFKGIILIEYPEFVKDGKLRGKTITSHDLIHLAKEAKIQLSNDEKNLCELASESIIHLGRYPIPKNKGESLGFMRIIYTIKEVYDAFFLRLSNEIPLRLKTLSGTATTI